MYLAVNYSHDLEALVQSGQVVIDRFKCPAWPDMIACAQQTLPVNIHFGLTVGKGIGNAWDVETRAPANGDAIEGLLRLTGTPLVNVHITPRVEDYPHIPPQSTRPEHVEEIVENALKDLVPLVHRFGARNVIAESLNGDTEFLTAGMLPDVIRRIVEAAGCDFLLDVSHARMSAAALGMDTREYFSRLPLERTRELHITGVHKLEGKWLEILEPVEPQMTARLRGRDFDHLPLGEADWAFLEWAKDELRAGRWGRPWIASFEYGGESGMWSALSDDAVLLEQIPRLAQFCRDVSVRE